MSFKSLSIVAAAALALCGGAAQAQNMFANGGFEAGQTTPVVDPTNAQGWLDAAAGYSRSSDAHSGLFSAQHGSWNRTKPNGAKIMFTSLKADGSADKTEVFAEGWLDSETNTFRGRPVDVANMKDGSMLVSDDYAGAIYRITYSE